MWTRFRAWWAGVPVLQTVIVNLKDGSAMRGVLWSVDRSWITLSNAELLENTPTALVGTILVPRANILFLQVPPPAA